MGSDPELHHRFGCCLSLQKMKIDTTDIAAEEVEEEHGTLNLSIASAFYLISALAQVRTQARRIYWEDPMCLSKLTQQNV